MIISKITDYEMPGDLSKAGHKNHPATRKERFAKRMLFVLVQLYPKMGTGRRIRGRFSRDEAFFYSMEKLWSRKTVV